MTDTHSTIIKELRAEQREMMVKLIDERAEVARLTDELEYSLDAFDAMREADCPKCKLVPENKRLTERDKVGRELLSGMSDTYWSHEIILAVKSYLEEA